MLESGSTKAKKEGTSRLGKVSEMEGPQKLGCELEAPAQPPCPDATRLVLTGPPGQPLISPVAHPPHPCFLGVCGCVCPLPWGIHTFMQNGVSLPSKDILTFQVQTNYFSPISPDIW